MRPSVFASLVFAAVVVFASEGRAQIHYVSHDGDNIYPYTTWETAAHKIQDAVDAAADQGGSTWWGAQYYGGDVHIAPGVYEERAIVVTGTTTLLGSGAEDTTILGSHASKTVTLKDWAGVSDLTVRQGFDQALLCLGEQHIISRCRVLGDPDADESSIRDAGGTTEVLLLDSVVETKPASLRHALISGCTFRSDSAAALDEGTVLDSVFEGSGVSGRRLSVIRCTIRGASSGVLSGDALFMEDCEVSDCWDGVSAGDCVISHCVIRDSRFVGIYAKTESGARISDCVISGGGAGIIVRAAGAFERQDGPIVIEGCVVSDCYGDPTGFYGADGISVSGSNVSISDCVSANNGFPGVGGAGIVLGYCGRVSNCTVVGNAAGGIVGKGEVLNSIIWGNHEPMTYDSELDIRYSCVEAGYAGEGNISEAPGILLADYEVPPDSPCIDAGDPACDYNLEPEPNGKRINLGAFGNTPNARTSEWVDTDSDNMRDDWEMLHFGDLGHDGSADTDADGLTDYQEYFYGTQPTRADSDGDGMWDGAEIESGMDPLGPGAYVKLVKMEMEEGGLRLVWRVFPRVRYLPLFSDSLRVWSHLDSDSTPKYRYVERVDADAGSLRMRFYRLETITKFSPPGS